MSVGLQILHVRRALNANSSDTQRGGEMCPRPLRCNWRCPESSVADPVLLTPGSCTIGRGVGTSACDQNMLTCTCGKLDQASTQQFAKAGCPARSKLVHFKAGASTSSSTSGRRVSPHRWEMSTSPSATASKTCLGPGAIQPWSLKAPPGAWESEDFFPTGQRHSFQQRGDEPYGSNPYPSFQDRAWRCEQPPFFRTATSADVAWSLSRVLRRGQRPECPIDCFSICAAVLVRDPMVFVPAQPVRQRSLATGGPTMIAVSCSLVSACG